MEQNESDNQNITLSQEPSVDNSKELFKSLNDDIKSSGKVSEKSHYEKLLSDQKLSKRKQKRLLREQQWLENKAERKRREKERRRERRNNQTMINQDQKKPRIELIKMCESKCKVSLVIDCDYESYMDKHEMKKLCKQLNRCYASNRHSSAPVQLWLTSITGKLRELLECLQPGHRRWDCHLTERHWSEMFVTYKSNKKLIYLSGDSPNFIPNCAEIQESNDYIFIIGGLIDHNRHKNLCLKRALKEFNVNHGQLPIDDYIRMSQRRILSIPHVFEIMLLASNGTIGQNWTEIFQKVIPKRKLW